MPKQSRDLPKHFKEYSEGLAKANGTRIEERRRQLKLTQETLRIKLELENAYVTRSQLSRLENGERLPDASEIIALSHVLKVSLQWLLLGDIED